MTMSPYIRRTTLTALAAAAVVAAAGATGCGEAVTPTHRADSSGVSTGPTTGPAAEHPAPPRSVMAITISGIGSQQMSAEATVPAQVLGASASDHDRAARFALLAPTNSGGGGDGTIQLSPLSTGTFTSGARGAGGVRYVWATFKVRNAQSDGTAYDTQRGNLTFFAVSTSGTIGGSAISTLLRYDGSAASSSIATQVVPTGNVYQQRTSVLPAQPDVLQVITDAEASALTVSGATVLPYGFVVQNVDGSRGIPASPAVGQYDGIVTFAFKFPLQSTAAADPYTITGQFQAVDDTQSRITESLEEQTTAGRAAFQTKAGAIGASLVTLLHGGVYTGASTQRMICSVRTAGTSAAPTAYLVNNGARRVVSFSPNPFSSGAEHISASATIAATGDCPFDVAPTGSNFTIYGSLHGRYFRSGSFTGGGTSTISAPSGTFLPGEQIEAVATNQLGPTTGYVARYRVATVAGAGTFGSEATIAVATSPLSVIAADVNGDGKVDLIVETTSSAAVSVLLGNGDGTFGAATTVATGELRPAVGDFNGDGKLDLATTSSGAVRLRLGNGDGTFGSPTTFSIPDNPLINPIAQLVAADMNGDGFQDLVALLSSTTIYSVLFGDGTGTLTSTSSANLTNGSAIAVGPAKADGTLSIFGTNGSPSQLVVDGTPYVTSGTNRALELGDFNGDGHVDAIVVSALAQLLLNNGDGTYGTATAINSGGAPFGIAVGDVNGDGKLDFVLAESSLNVVRVLVGNGDGTFATPVDYSVGTSPRRVVLVDLNGDGRLDMVASNFSSGTLSIRLGQP